MDGGLSGLVAGVTAGSHRRQSEINFGLAL